MDYNFKESSYRSETSNFDDIAKAHSDQKHEGERPRFSVQASENSLKTNTTITCDKCCTSYEVLEEAAAAIRIDKKAERILNYKSDQQNYQPPTAQPQSQPYSRNMAA